MPHNEEIFSMRDDHILELTRKDLLDLVWSKPMRDAAPDVGVSDSGLRKICQRHRVPRPPRGYFLMHADRRPEKPDLPAVDDARLDTIRFFPGRRGAPVDDAIPPDIRALIDEEASPERRIVVANRLTRPHPLVEAVRQELMSQKTPDYGLPILASNAGQLRVRVTRSSVPRAMRILDALVKAAEVRGFRIRVDDNGYKKDAVLEACGETILFRLDEKLRRLERASGQEDGPSLYSWGRYEYEATGTLQLEIDSYSGRVNRRRWKDGRRRSVENALNEFFVSALKAAAAMRERAERWEAEERERQRLAQERAERERLIRQEKRRVDALVDAVEAWHLARRVREYVTFATQHAADVAPEWARWALEQADRFDPTSPSPPSILDEKNRDGDLSGDGINPFGE